ncbi:MAG: biopolymer transport protein ExbB/TolQ [Candidatus Saccharimonadales bacterium]|jgi:biopolymer transport protein ExbB/TolQ
MESYDILVILLSVALGTFLILGIWSLALFIQVMKKVKETTESARHTAEHVEEIVNNMKGASKATAVGSTIAQFAKFFNKQKDKK